jgi:hypothetical protein
MSRTAQDEPVRDDRRDMFPIDRSERATAAGRRAGIEDTPERVTEETLVHRIECEVFP